MRRDLELNNARKPAVSGDFAPSPIRQLRQRLGGWRTRARTWDPMIKSHWLDPRTDATVFAPAMVNANSVSNERPPPNVPQT